MTLPQETPVAAPTASGGIRGETYEVDPTHTPKSPRLQDFRPRLDDLPPIANTVRSAAERVKAARADLRHVKRIARDVANRAQVERLGGLIAPGDMARRILNAEIETVRRMLTNAESRLTRAIARQAKLRRRGAR